MRRLFIALGITLACASYVGAQSYDWAITAQGTSFGADEGKAVCMDAEGNSYFTGSFSSSSFALGKFSLTNTSSSPATNFDMFVAKVDRAGKVLWAMQSKGSGEERGIDIACDKTGHIVVVGIFKGASATFGTAELKNPGINSFSTFIMRMERNIATEFSNQHLVLDGFTVDPSADSVSLKIRQRGEKKGSPVKINLQATKGYDFFRNIHNMEMV